MQKIRDLGNTPCREATIRKLMAEYGATHRMVERCLAEFLPAIRMYRYATKGAEIQPLPARKIEKLKPGIYTDKKLSLRLIVDSAGNRKWFFRFLRGSRRSFVITDKMLGGSELSLATARELATKAHRMVADGQDP
jgi:Arm domain-containing DNA-binding protein